MFAAGRDLVDAARSSAGGRSNRGAFTTASDCSDERSKDCSRADFLCGVFAARIASERVCAADEGIGLPLKFELHEFEPEFAFRPPCVRRSWRWRGERRRRHPPGQRRRCRRGWEIRARREKSHPLCSRKNRRYRSCGWSLWSWLEPPLASAVEVAELELELESREQRWLLRLRSGAVVPLGRAWDFPRSGVRRARTAAEILGWLDPCDVSPG